MGYFLNFVYASLGIFGFLALSAVCLFLLVATISFGWAYGKMWGTYFGFKETATQLLRIKTKGK